LKIDHAEIEWQETIDRYLRGELAPQERRAFEEHFFACDHCFEGVQTAERFAAGVRAAASAGLLDSGAEGRAIAAATRVWSLRFRLAQAITLAAVVAAGSLSLYQISRLRSELKQEVHKREEIQQKAKQDLRRAQEALLLEMRQRPAADARFEPNIPLVILEATRGKAGNNLNIPAGARALVFWIEPGQETAFTSFQLRIYASENQLLETVEGLKKNTYGALAASLASETFRTGRYLVKLYGVNGQRLTLLQEYILQIRRN
jgi:hypothetical protein